MYHAQSLPVASRCSLWAARRRGKRNPEFRKIPKIRQIGDDFRPKKSQLFPQNLNFSGILRNLEPVRLQMDLSPSSGGVGWANGYCGVLIATHTQRVASFWGSGKPGNTISRVLEKNLTFFCLICLDLGYLATQLRKSVV